MNKASLINVNNIDELVSEYYGLEYDNFSNDNNFLVAKLLVIRHIIGYLINNHRISIDDYNRLNMKVNNIKMNLIKYFGHQFKFHFKDENFKDTLPEFQSSININIEGIKSIDDSNIQQAIHFLSGNDIKTIEVIGSISHIYVYFEKKLAKKKKEALMEEYKISKEEAGIIVSLIESFNNIANNVKGVRHGGSLDSININDVRFLCANIFMIIYKILKNK